MKESAVVLANHRFDTPNGQDRPRARPGLRPLPGDRGRRSRSRGPRRWRGARRPAGRHPRRGGPRRGDRDRGTRHRSGASSVSRPTGGRLLPELHTLVLEAVGKGLGVVNGLHDATSEDAEVAAAARGARRGADRSPQAEAQARAALLGGRHLRCPRASPRGAGHRLCAGKAHHHPHHRPGDERGRGALRDDSTPARPAGCRERATGSCSTRSSTTSSRASSSTRSCAATGRPSPI